MIIDRRCRKAKLTAATILATSIAGIVGVPTANRYFNTPSPNISNVKGTLNPSLSTSNNPERTQLIPVKPSPTETAALTPSTSLPIVISAQEKLKEMVPKDIELWEAYHRPEKGRAKPRKMAFIIVNKECRKIEISNQTPNHPTDKTLMSVGLSIQEPGLPTKLKLRGEDKTVFEMDPNYASYSLYYYTNVAPSGERPAQGITKQMNFFVLNVGERVLVR